MIESSIPSRQSELCSELQCADVRIMYTVNCHVKTHKHKMSEPYIPMAKIDRKWCQSDTAFVSFTNCNMHSSLERIGITSRPSPGSKDRFICVENSDKKAGNVFCTVAVSSKKGSHNEH